jgi:hypothetical protein
VESSGRLGAYRVTRSGPVRAAGWWLRRVRVPGRAGAVRGGAGCAAGGGPCFPESSGTFSGIVRSRPRADNGGAFAVV